MWQGPRKELCFSQFIIISFLSGEKKKFLVMKRKGMVAIWGKLCIKDVVMIKASDTYKRKTKDAEKKMGCAKTDEWSRQV